MTFQKRTHDLLERHGLGHAPQTHALDLVSEVGGGAKVPLEASEYGRSPLIPNSALAEELGDAFYSLIALADSLDVDLEAALEGVLEKYQSRLAAQGHAGSADSRGT